MFPKYKEECSKKKHAGWMKGRYVNFVFLSCFRQIDLKSAYSPAGHVFFFFTSFPCSGRASNAVLGPFYRNNMKLQT